ncbi:hypothetical protein D3C72_2295930 [compost metagenome]
MPIVLIAGLVPPLLNAHQNLATGRLFGADADPQIAIELSFTNFQAHITRPTRQLLQ